MTRKSTKGILHFSRLRNFFICAVIILGICAILAACSPSQVELDAPDTELAIDTSATQTTISKITESPTVTPADPAQYTPNPEAVTLVEEAFSYSQQGDDEKAIETYTQAIEIDPSFALAYVNRGAVYADNGELEKALDDFNIGLELDPTNLFGYANRGMAFNQSENPDMAMEDVKSILALTEDEQYIKNALLLGGMIYEQQGEIALALSAYSTALHIDEFYTPALFQRGQIYFQQGDWLRAFSDLMLILEITDNQEIQKTTIDILMGVYPEGTTLQEAMAAGLEFYTQAMTYKDSGNFQSSAEALTKAIEVDPFYSESYFQRGLILANLGEMDQAITAMSYKIALDPFDPAGYYYRGLIKSDYGMVAEAIADLEKALEFDNPSQAVDIATQTLETLRQRLETCRMTEFEVVNDAETPTFLFTFIGLPDTDFIIATIPVIGSIDGTVHVNLSTAPTPEDGVTHTGTQYKLGAGETPPIDLKIIIAMAGCTISKVVTWPAIDIIALLSGN